MYSALFFEMPYIVGFPKLNKLIIARKLVTLSFLQYIFLGVYAHIISIQYNLWRVALKWVPIDGNRAFLTSNQCIVNTMLTGVYIAKLNMDVYTEIFYW